MATVVLQKPECEDGALPHVCIVCGEPSEYEPVAKRFYFMPVTGYVIVFVAAFTAIAIMVYSEAFAWAVVGTSGVVTALVLRSRTVWTPLCEEHRDYWSNRRLAALVRNSAALGNLIAIFVLPRLNAPPWAFMASNISFLAVMFTLAALTKNTVRTLHIEVHEITLDDVHRSFCAALQIQRQVQFQQLIAQELSEG